MTEPAAHKTLIEALIAAQAEFSAVAKETKNEFFHSTYADLAAVKASAQPVLAKHGLAVTQEPGYLVVGDQVIDTLRTTLLHTSGEERTSEMVLRPVKKDPQAQGSAITYAKRYAFMAVLGLVADDDDDGNAASAPARKPAARKAPAKPAEDDPAAQALKTAFDEVKASALAAGVTGKEAAAKYKELYGEAFMTSTNVDHLNELRDHYDAISAAKDGLGATEVAE